MSRLLRRAQISGSSLRHMYQQITINLLTENIGEDLMGQGIVNLKKDFPEQLTEISSSQIGCHLKFTNSNNNGRGEAKSPPFPAKRKYIFTQRNATLIFGLILLRLLNFYFFQGTRILRTYSQLPVTAAAGFHVQPGAMRGSCIRRLQNVTLAYTYQVVTQE